MGKKYIIDTSTIIRLITNAGFFKADDRRFLLNLSRENTFLSFISVIELMSFQVDDDSQIKLREEFVSRFRIIYVDNSIVKQTIEIKKNHRIKTPDAIIAATSILEQLTLITLDKDFYKVDGLGLYFPH